jgi:hypothetical protein
VDVPASRQCHDFKRLRHRVHETTLQLQFNLRSNIYWQLARTSRNRALLTELQVFSHPRNR